MDINYTLENEFTTCIGTLLHMEVSNIPCNGKKSNSHVEGVSDCCLTPNEQYFNYIIARTNYNQWDDDGICFVLEKHA